MIGLGRRHYVGTAVGAVLLTLVVLFAQIPRTSVIGLVARGLPWGSNAPRFVLSTAKGDSIEFPQSEAPCLLVFTSSSCRYSQDLKKKLRSREPIGQWGSVILVNAGDLTVAKTTPELSALEEDIAERYLTLWDPEEQIFKDYQVGGVPAAYWVERGTILCSTRGLTRSLSLLEDLGTKLDAAQ